AGRTEKDRATLVRVVQNRYDDRRMVPATHRRSRMPTIITPERPDSADAVALILELETHLASLYPVESRHGYSVAKLLAEGVAFFVLRDNGTPAGCGGILLFGRQYGELKRMYVRPSFRG